MKLRGVCLAAAITAATGTSYADVLTDSAKKLVTLEAEAQQIGSSIQKPKAQTQTDIMSRRLIDAQVSFGVGDFDSAALLLYDYVAQKTRGREFDTALYYLAESLFQKGDRIGSRKHFAMLVRDVGRTSKYYQQSLERLIELSLLLDAHEGSPDGTITEWIGNLDAIPTDKQQPSVPYVRGKYAFGQGKFAEAINWFKKVPQSGKPSLTVAWNKPLKNGVTTQSPALSFQATYYIGASYVALKDLDQATTTFEELIKRSANTPDERSVLELGQIALARVYYERDQPTKALDTYLFIDRRSDLFPVVLHEVAWLYVKGKQYDKALRALELLTLVDPNSKDLPTVRIMEGNLRIRKAQSIHEKLIGGILSGSESGLDEYVRADEIFTATHETYRPSHDELKQIIEARHDPQEFLDQITGRSSTTFLTKAIMPEIAASWVRDEPTVGRVVGVETDLGIINDEIEESKRTIERLEAALSAANRVHVFPSLAGKSIRATEILEEILAMRARLADDERTLAAKSSSGADRAQLEVATQQRKAIAARLAQLPGAGLAYNKRIDLARGDYDELERATSEIFVTTVTTRSTAVAIDKFLKDSQSGEADPAASGTNVATGKGLAEVTVELDAMQKELDSLRRELVLARDAAGSGDEFTQLESRLRGDLRTAFTTEHAAMEPFARRTDPTRSTTVSALMSRSDGILTQLDRAQAAIAEVVEGELIEVRASIEREKAELAAYEREFLLYEAESRVVGGEVLLATFEIVKNKFYDILVRTDVGVVDVNWAQKEEADDDLQRLNLDKQREIKHLRDDFADLMREAKTQAALSQPAPVVPPSATPDDPAGGSL